MPLLDCYPVLNISKSDIFLSVHSRNLFSEFSKMKTENLSQNYKYVRLWEEPVYIMMNPYLELVFLMTALVTSGTAFSSWIFDLNVPSGFLWPLDLDDPFGRPRPRLTGATSVSVDSDFTSFFAIFWNYFLTKICCWCSFLCNLTDTERLFSISIYTKMRARKLVWSLNQLAH